VTAEAQASASIGRAARPPAVVVAVWRLILLISLGGTFEFYDLMMTAYIAPGLIKAASSTRQGRAFGLTDQATFAAATFSGLFIGTMVFSQIADRFGRAGDLHAVAALVHRRHPGHGLPVHSHRPGHLATGRRIGIGVELVTIDAYITELRAGPARPGLRGEPGGAVRRRADRGAGVLAARSARAFGVADGGG